MKRSLYLLMTILLAAVPQLFAGLNISPSRAEISMPAGQSYTNAYMVTNAYDIPIDVGVATKDWYVTAENKGIGIDDWLRVSTDGFHLAVGESREVQYEVSVPTQAVGSLVGMISFSPSMDREEGISLVVSVPVFVKVTGTEVTAWDATDIRFANQNGKLQVAATVRNTGNIHLRPTGEAVFVSKKQVETRIAFNESRPVYPGSYRTIVGVGDMPAQGSYQGTLRIMCAGQQKSMPFKMKVTKKGVIKTTWPKK